MSIAGFTFLNILLKLSFISVPLLLKYMGYFITFSHEFKYYIVRKAAAPIASSAVGFLVIPEISRRYFLHNKNEASASS